MLTGDNPKVARVIAERVGIKSVWANLLPDQKAEHIKQLQSEGRKIAMVGDGINDAPSLSVANVGISMSEIGTDIAIEAADIIFMSDDLSKLQETVLIGKRTVKTIKQNIFYFAVIFNLLAVTAASFFAFITPVWAAIIHQISSFLVVGNSLRLLSAQKVKDEIKQKACIFWQFIMQDLGRNGKRWISEHDKDLLKYIIVCLVLIYILSGFYTIKPNQVGVVQIFGKRLSQPVASGLGYFPPWPVGKLTKLSRSIDRVEIGFRSKAAKDMTSIQNDANLILQPIVAYEWDIQHRTGAYQDNPSESQTFTGDENFIELDMVVHYKIKDPALYLFSIRGKEDAESLIRFTGKSTIIQIIGEKAIDDILTSERIIIEKEAKEALQSILDGYNSGIEIVGVYLQSVHPPIEVADAFRDVVNANEEKSRLINLAEAYNKEQLPLARGNAFTSLEDARAYRQELIDKSTGDGEKFLLSALEFSDYPLVTKERLYLETMEIGLAGLKKFVMDKRRGGKSGLTIFGPKDIKDFMETLTEGFNNNARNTSRGSSMGGRE
jgi:HflK protein